MLRPGTQDALIRGKVNMPTAKSHAELVRDVEPKLKAQAFFSARVAEAHILDRLREVSDGYSRGEFGLSETDVADGLVRLCREQRLPGCRTALR